jgi:hypothetical protein
MDKYRESRYAAQQPVTVTILSGEPSSHGATIKDCSGTGMALEMPAPVAPGAAIQIAFDDQLLLGEAIHCCEKDGRFVVGVQLHTKLSQLSRLAEMVERFSEGEPVDWPTRSQRR